MRILFVDNHPEFTATVVEKFLREHVVLVVPTIAAAKEQLETGTFDVVLVDYDLDDGKGDELVRWLRARRTSAKLIAVSARDRGNEALRAAGVDDVCPKLEFSRLQGLLATNEVSPTIRELGTWDGSAALLIDGGTGDPARPPLHLQAAGGGYLRLMSSSGPVLWGRVDPGWYGVDIVRAKDATIRVLPPLRGKDIDCAPGSAGSVRFVNWWTRQYASLLCTASNTPLAQGRCFLFAPDRIELRRQHLELFVEQREEFALSWDGNYAPLLLLRPLSDADDGRVKMWRKRARDKMLPPLVTWWCHGLYSHVLLDGHDRVHAALLEGARPDVIVLANAIPRARDEVTSSQQRATDMATILERIPLLDRRAFSMNLQLRYGWDPKAEWTIATPGFPLEGGVTQWEEEVRGTWIGAESSPSRG